MYVTVEARRKGVGKALVMKLREWMREKGVARIYVSAYSKNVLAISFYRAAGFVEWSSGLEMKV